MEADVSMLPLLPLLVGSFECRGGRRRRRRRRAAAAAAAEVAELRDLIWDPDMSFCVAEEDKLWASSVEL